MAREKTDLLNAYELLLLQKILTVLFDLEEKDMGKKTFKEVGAELEVDSGTIAKFFNASYNPNVPSFNKKLLDEIVGRLNLERVNTWDYFKKLHTAPSLEYKPKDYIPHGHLRDLSGERKSQIIADVKSTLPKLFPNRDLSKITYDSFENIEGELLQEPSVKMKKNFLGTKWFLYGSYYNMGNPKLGRLVLRIGDTPQDVKLENLGTPEDTHYNGTVRFDKSQSYLIFNLTTITGEKDFHIKVATSTGERPEIMLGYFFSIGSNFPTLTWGDLVMEGINDLADEDIKAVTLGASDPEFSNVHWSIREYLRYEDPTVTLLPSKIYSKQKLDLLVKTRKSAPPSKLVEIRQQVKLKILISYPKFSLPENARSKYLNARRKLEEFLVEKEFDVLEEPSQEAPGKPIPPLPAHFFYNRVRECDIFVLLFFDQVVSHCLSELAWAFQMGKRIIIVSSDREMIPRTFKFDQSVFIQSNVGSDLDEAVNWLMDMHSILFKMEE